MCKVSRKTLQCYASFPLQPKICIILIILAGLSFGLLWFGINNECNQKYMPKPRGHCRIDLPEQAYQHTKENLPYQFEYSVHADILESKSMYKQKFWVDLYYPQFEATIYISYQSITDDPILLAQLCQHASELAFKHSSQAASIEESIIQTPKGYQATVIELFGQVPTPFQFYITDGKKHFLRGALYLKTASQNDFLEPVIEFIKKDIIHMLNTLEWKS
ncbi:gliding motility lipoprotein GldD [Cardinium endosymbiont of Culicoides punctatus]|uniref:gliding motility lipoprotein GldD n=1 Tax=Cardinium endosymbiont of Culicoides punctatus TaxID=2304601 RepID=UPI0010EAD41D|nr:gliding motility lipoprotein GldD [Cardinium endosymbiont of Culicoides punctatus]TDG94358.1 hypothetical protein CCPUN_08240 [Cardinium endosymbiont of Culicoides punctatus]